MSQKIKVKHTKTTFIIGIIVLSLFLGFGIFFFVLLSSEPDAYIGQGFLAFWMLIILILLIYFIYSLKNYDKKNVLGTELILEETSPKIEGAQLFDEKLKRLEALKEQCLITYEEYEIKRKEILQEKW